MKIIKNGKILDQQGNLVQKDIQIENGLITKISENIENPNAERCRGEIHQPWVYRCACPSP